MYQAALRHEIAAVAVLFDDIIRRQTVTTRNATPVYSISHRYAAFDIYDVTCSSRLPYTAPVDQSV